MIDTNMNENYEILKIHIINKIQRFGKEIIKYNKLLSQVKGLKTFTICDHNLYEEDDFKKIQPDLMVKLHILENKIKTEKQIKERNLAGILSDIMTLGELKKLFGINGNIENEVQDIFINDILEGLELLTFNNSSNISKFILTYMQKFI